MINMKLSMNVNMKDGSTPENELFADLSRASRVLQKSKHISNGDDSRGSVHRLMQRRQRQQETFGKSKGSESNGTG